MTHAPKLSKMDHTEARANWLANHHRDAAALSVDDTDYLVVTGGAIAELLDIEHAEARTTDGALVASATKRAGETQWTAYDMDDNDYYHEDPNAALVMAIRAR